MPSSPIISIFRSSGGQAVARGVLIAGTGDSVIGAAGLFSPWPESLTEGAEFSIYVPGSDGQPEEWLQPKQFGILDLSGEEHATYGVVSFVEEPTNVSLQPATTQQHHPATGKWLEAMESERASELKQLRELDTSAPIQELTPPPTKVGRPVNVPTVTTDTVVTSFVCRYVLRWD